MTTDKTHEAMVDEQFGRQAEAYVASPVHAAGEDLDQLERLAARLEPGQALDMGCGGGHASYRLSPHVLQVTACDLSESMLRAVEAEAGRRGLKNIVTRRCTVHDLPFPDAAFDLVVSRYSAHHWTDLSSGLAQARRVLKPGGTAVFMDSVAPRFTVADTFLQAMEILRDPSHVRDYSQVEWLRAVEEAGFKPVETVRHRVRLDFTSWTGRMATPEEHVRAILSLQKHMPSEVAGIFQVEPDGSFTIDKLTLVALG